MELLRKTTRYSLLDHKRNKLMTKELKTTPTGELTTAKQKSAAAYISNGTLQTSKSDVSVRPQKKTVKMETSKEMAGDRNRSLGPLLERMGDCGGTVVKVLCYKSEGRWFDSRWCH
jgi:hypothetical protein